MMDGWRCYLDGDCDMTKRSIPKGKKYNVPFFFPTANYLRQRPAIYLEGL